MNANTRNFEMELEAQEHMNEREETQVHPEVEVVTATAL